MRWVPLTISIFAAAIFAQEGDDLPAGPGKEAFLKMCTACHGVAQVTAHKYPRKFWESVVDDMVSRGADGTDEEVEAVIGYLTRNFGKPVNVNTSSAAEIEAGLSFSAVESEALVRYRSEKGAFQKYEDLLKVPGLNAALLEEQKKNILF